MPSFFTKLRALAAAWHSQREETPVALLNRTDSEGYALEQEGDGETEGLPLGQAVEQLFERVGSTVLDRIRKVNTLTETEVLSAGNALNEIVGEARAHVELTKATLSQIVNDRSDDSMTSLVTRQAQRSEEFLQRVEGLIAQQATSAKHAMGLSNRIATLGEEISTIAFQSRLLSLNASVEAARLSEQGAAFGVISVEMKRLSDAVEVTNRSVADLAEELAAALPDIASKGYQLLECSQGFRGELESGLSEIQRATTALKTTIAESLSEGDTRIDRVIHASHDALSHLQFQDVCAQSLLIIDRDLINARSTVNELVCEAGAATAKVASDSTLRFGVATSHRDLSAGEVAVMNDDEEAPLAGDVMLF